MDELIEECRGRVNMPKKETTNPVSLQALIEKQMKNPKFKKAYLLETRSLRWKGKHRLRGC